ncbi:MAG: helix-turn-helix transcriptional regulator [Limnochordia bacterium]|jgi:AraC-like DNA-binding protein
MEWEEKSMAWLVEDFYGCTQLPVGAFNAQGQLLQALGLTRLLTPEQLRMVTEQIQEGKIERLSCCLAQLEVPEVGLLAVQALAGDSMEEGYLLFGPFDEEGRPSRLLPHLARLVRQIQEGLLFGGKICPHGRRRQIGSFHVRRALAYVDRHYSQEITLEALAQQLGINKSYLSTLFKEETGMAFSQWVNRVRIERSKELLKETSRSITEIAFDVGYASHPYFTSTFRKYTGMTPQQYRLGWREYENTSVV